ncbi:fusaric acid resistance protein FusB [Acetobacter malorum]|uniref:Fusaric acid resistance protein FusB n=1 Tax=Acetobacter malorum TaxID=178901 RepID=A0A177GGB2_9PROT|nr:fusaric acid resistance protein FusB [Acetobacter malorum]
MRSAVLSLGQLWQAFAQIARQTLLGSGPPRKLDHFRWLYAPDLLSFGYALRTTISALIALGIALWWELGSPQWAALTVWMVAQGTRGKSIAKARWHMFGMVVGTICAIVLVACMPQAPLLYLLCLAGGIGPFLLYRHTAARPGRHDKLPYSRHAGVWFYLRHYRAGWRAGSGPYF